jgi:hypothetical protein
MPQRTSSSTNSGGHKVRGLSLPGQDQVSPLRLEWEQSTDFVAGLIFFLPPASDC